MENQTARSDSGAVDIEVTETEIVLQAKGELTGSAYTRLSDLMHKAVAHHELPIILHFQHATGIDSKVLSLLHTTGQQMILSQRRFTMHVTAETQPSRVLEMSQMDQLLPLLQERNGPGLFTIINHPAQQPD